MNKTAQEIKNSFLDLMKHEDELRGSMRNYLSRALMFNDENNKLECNICLDIPEAMGLSSLNMPWVDEVWQDTANGYINFKLDTGAIVDFDDLSTQELMGFIEDLERMQL
jgi:hypothetical protein